jgi:L-alanine-DL-glutamate epimerase-like enolase superfamily enzyme
MTHPTDFRPIGAAVYFLPVTNRVPLKFGREVVTAVKCARVRLRVRSRDGREAEGWGETPLSVTWAWPGTLGYETREQLMLALCVRLAESWAGFDFTGDVLELGHAFQTEILPGVVEELNARQPPEAAMPWLAALVCCSAFDVALHDAFGQLGGRPVYEMYGPAHLNRDLAAYLEPAAGSTARFAGLYPHDFLLKQTPARLPVWHLVGGVDPLAAEDVAGPRPSDNYPFLLRDWIERDGLRCLKIKLRGDDAAWDYDRLLRIGKIAVELEVPWLTTDFNCTVRDPQYVIEILDRLVLEQPRLYGSILYVEQPFPYNLHEFPIDVHAISARKPLFMDESAHDWKYAARGRELGWTGVALKTCKTQTGALLSACWARAHGMTLMVQDLTNPMLALLPHVQLAAHVGTIMGVEANAAQFYPDASLPETHIHPGLYRRRQGEVDLQSIRGPGFGYRLEEINRTLPTPAGVFGAAGPAFTATSGSAPARFVAAP